MPSLLNPIYASVVRVLPVMQHQVTIDANFWRPFFTAANQGALGTAIFGRNACVTLSRNRLRYFLYPTPEQKCAEILLWGYPNNMRGVVSRLLPNLTALSGHAVAPLPWPNYYTAFPKGCGISTVTKFAYFHGRTFAGHAALILDSRLIANTAHWTETNALGLNYQNAHQRYLTYLSTMYATATNPGLTCTADQLEFFLFALGDSF